MHCGRPGMGVASNVGHLAVLPRTPVVVHQCTKPWLRSGLRSQDSSRFPSGAPIMRARGVVPASKKQWSSWRTVVSPVLVPVSGDRVTYEPETDLEGRLAALAARETVFAERMRFAQEILAAADARDALADARDLAADRRENEHDLLEFLAPGGDYGRDWPDRRAAGLDREQAKDDRKAARRDRVALAQDWVESSGGFTPPTSPREPTVSEPILPRPQLAASA